MGAAVVIAERCDHWNVKQTLGGIRKIVLWVVRKFKKFSKNRYFSVSIEVTIFFEESLFSVQYRRYDCLFFIIIILSSSVSKLRFSLDPSLVVSVYCSFESLS